MAANPSGNVDISLIVNGSTPLVIFNRPADAGYVGLTIFGHGMEVIFDNFEIESEESPTFSKPFGPESGPDLALETFGDLASEN